MSKVKKSPNHGKGVRQEKGKPESKQHVEPKSSSSPMSSFISFKTVFAVLCLAVAAVFSYKGYLETRVNTPFDSPKVVIKSGLAVPERYWGTYRPGLYFGLKTREPYSPVMGLMWYQPHLLVRNGEGLRHWCEQGDNLDHFMWTHHDGKTFGVQDIIDGRISLKTSFVKRFGGSHGGDWTARIGVYPRETSAEGETVNLIFYTAIETQTKGRIAPTFNRVFTGVVGETQELGQFVVHYTNVTGSVERQSYLSVESKGLHLLKETILTQLRDVADRRSRKRSLVLPGDVTRVKEKTVEPNFIATQFEVRVPFEFDVVYESGSFVDRPNTLTGDFFTRELDSKLKSFNERFEKTFRLKQKGFNEEKISFAKSVFSSLIGGVGYFYGSSKVQSDHTTTPVPYWKAPLYTAVPSRTVFPRGFAWDEGFHGLLLASWDLDVELDVMGHWFDLINVEGWIPREQILDKEALARVPEEFVIQRNSNANPPTFFLTLRHIIHNYAEKLTEEDRLGTLERLYPRLVVWFDWFNTTQAGPLPGSYRWRGRDPAAIKELNPKTLTSGLDDYPRASHPTDDERHLDLRCWIMLSAATLAEIAKLLNKDGRKYVETYARLSDQSLLDELHWSEEKQRYVDYGLHTDDVTLKRPPLPPHQQSRQVKQDKIRVVLTEPTLRLVDSTFGYNSLFPLIAHIFPSNSPRLSRILTDLRNPDHLWTDYGLRSLSKKSPLYEQWNTEHDPPYWRCNIWINVNYLVLEALNYYSRLEGPYQEQAANLYSELRANIINNVFNQYKKSGYLWENYDSKTGVGKFSKSFTGWTSLVVMIMAEIF